MKQLMIIVTVILCVNSPLWAACPSADLTGDCKVTLEDFAIMASQWLTQGTPAPFLSGMTWVSISDPGVSGHEGFIGEMSKEETTNAHYCQFLNAAFSTGDITVVNYNHPVYGYIYCVGGVTGLYAGAIFYWLDGAGITVDGATNGGAARINYSGGVFSVDSGFENHPVTYVSWYGAMAFASYYGWRLPTEWEWQAVADYNGSFTYGCGTTINNSMANYQGSIHPDGTTAVGQFGTYGYGMADMAGNVWEWTSSLWDQIYGERVLRGGSWNSGGGDCGVSSRIYSNPGGMYHFLGFRVCR